MYIATERVRYEEVAKKKAGRHQVQDVSALECIA